MQGGQTKYHMCRTAKLADLGHHINKLKYLGAEDNTTAWPKGSPGAALASFAGSLLLNGLPTTPIDLRPSQCRGSALLTAKRSM